MELIDSLKELLEREWGDTTETEFILDAVKEYLEIHPINEKKEIEKKVLSATQVFDRFIDSITGATP